MINISILALKNAVPASIADACYVFATVNELLEQSGKEPLFSIQLVGLQHEVILNHGSFLIKPHVLIEEAKQPDLITGIFNLSRRSFERRFKKATRSTVVEYIQRVKIEASKKQLETGRKSIEEVMFDVGYSDVKTFRDVFKKITGMTPNEYRYKYNKE